MSNVGATHQARAVELRDLALTVIRERGEWRDLGGARMLGFTTAGLTLLHRTPFQTFPNRPPMPDKAKYMTALERKAPPDLPYGLDVWSGGKVLNVEWDDERAYVISYTPGQWEAELEKLAIGEGA